MEENKCYFPSDITVGKEFVTGFGKRELLQTAKGCFAGLVLSIILYMIFKSAILSMTAFITIATASAAVCIRMSGTNLSFVDEIKNHIRFVRSQKVFLFQYFDEWRK